MKSVKEYIAESAKEHTYILKMAVEPSEAQVNAVQSLLRSYGLVDFGKLKKVEDDRFDFFDVPTKDVWSIRFSARMPISSYVVVQQIRDVVTIPEKYIVVRASNEPVEVEAEDERFKNNADLEAKEKGLVTAPLLSIKQFYDDAEQPMITDLYGNQYNKNFLLYLSGVKSSRKSDEFDPPAPLFSWIQMKKVKSAEPVQDTADFNAQYDTPKPVVNAKGDEPEPIVFTALGSNGNLDDGAMKNVRLLLDPKTGKRSAITAPRANKNVKG